jgi:membrane-bound lytic murein transglycosylase A
MDLRSPRISVPRIFCLAGLVALTSCVPRVAGPEIPADARAELRLTRANFSELANWGGSNPGDAFEAFTRSCGAITAKPEDASMNGAPYGGTARDWLSACDAAVTVPVDDGEAIRAFFESEFVPYWAMEGENQEALFTGYFEPELRGSRIRQGVYQTPLYGVPADLVSVDLGLFRESLAGQRIAGRVAEGRLVPFGTRADIARGGLEQAEALLYVDDPIDAFFLQIQGSGRVQLDDGSVVRAAYAGQNGHPYTAIGAVLIAREELTREEVSMQSIRDWLRANPNDAQDLLDANASYVFFTIEPLDDPALGARGTQGVPLTAEASLAVDVSRHPLGIPVWVETTVPSPDQGEREFRRLLIAQDTGGAIRGALRGDIYWGVGDRAGEVAGRMRSFGKMAVLVPLGVAQDIGDNFVQDRPAP